MSVKDFCCSGILNSSLGTEIDDFGICMHSRQANEE